MKLNPNIEERVKTHGVRDDVLITDDGEHINLRNSRFRYDLFLTDEDIRELSAKSLQSPKRTYGKSYGRIGASYNNAA